MNKKAVHTGAVSQVKRDNLEASKLTSHGLTPRRRYEPAGRR